jgi:hypothetical protein
VIEEAIHLASTDMIGPARIHKEDVGFGSSVAKLGQGLVERWPRGMMKGTEMDHPLILRIAASQVIEEATGLRGLALIVKDIQSHDSWHTELAMMCGRVSRGCDVHLHVVGFG